MVGTSDAKKVGIAIKEGGALVIAVLALLIVAYLLFKSSAAAWTEPKALKAWEKQDLSNRDNHLEHREIMQKLVRLDERIESVEDRMTEHHGLPHHTTSDSPRMLAMCVTALEDIQRRLQGIESKLDGD